MTHHKTKIIAESGKQELVIIREFDSPRELVFEAFTDPELYTKWFGSSNAKIIVDKDDSRSGGNWRLLQKDEDGNEYIYHGVYHEFRPPESIISTFEFEGKPETISLEKTLFEELPENRTRLTIKTVYLTEEYRDDVLEQGYQYGTAKELNEYYERLDDLLERMKKEEVRNR